jgi:tyrosyl-tRNA synthetase
MDKSVEALMLSSEATSSKGETKKLIQGGGVSVNKEKITDATQVFNTEHLINGKFIVVQKGRRNYFLLIAE